MSRFSRLWYRLGFARRARSRRTFLFQPGCEHLEPRRLLATFTVTTTADNVASPPSGSLRQAIVSANVSPGLDNIVFDIPGSDQQTIALQGALPALTSPVNILGDSQPVFSTSSLLRR
jgi:hypothetical protein